MNGDITKLKIDCIVNAANNSLLGGGGVDGAIHHVAGPELLQECRQIGGCLTGEARITKGYNLPADYVIHTVGPVYSNTDGDEILLSNCYKNSLQLAVRHKISSIAFPAISCGVYGYPILKACPVAFNTTCNFLKSNQSIKKVIFILFSSQNYNIYNEYINKYN